MSGEVDLTSASAFVAATGLELTEVTGTRVAGSIELGPQHHTPWGVVHGGVYCTVVESAASIGASTAVAEPVQQGKTLQLWLVTLSRADDGKIVARGQVRLQNVPLPGA